MELTIMDAPSSSATSEAFRSGEPTAARNGLNCRCGTSDIVSLKAKCFLICPIFPFPKINKHDLTCLSLSSLLVCLKLKAINWEFSRSSNFCQLLSTTFFFFMWINQSILKSMTAHSLALFLPKYELSSFQHHGIGHTKISRRRTD